MSRTLLAVVVALAGCDRVWQLDTIAETHMADAGLDAESERCFGSAAGLIQPCAPTPLTATLALGGLLDTTDDTRCIVHVQRTGIEVCVIAAASITVSAPLVVRGSRPLVIAAADTIVITAPITASSSVAFPGPGAQATCGTAGNGTGSTTGGGGGAGGPFKYVGGNASIGGGSIPSVHPPDPPQMLIDVRGGCPGYLGGTASSTAATPARGGAGGGAIYFTAGASIAVQSGAINASGEAGAGGATRGGGGGGGSGGLIGFDAPTVTVNVQLIARGAGGGGGGSDSASGFPGTEATDATSSVPGGPAQTSGGGSSAGWPGCGGPNGEGGGNGPATLFAAGGGGGGGACGFIQVYATTFTLTTMTSPKAEHVQL